jgi:hypothetical protein
MKTLIAMCSSLNRASTPGTVPSLASSSSVILIRVPTVSGTFSTTSRCRVTSLSGSPITNRTWQPLSALRRSTARRFGSSSHRK